MAHPNHSLNVPIPKEIPLPSALDKGNVLPTLILGSLFTLWAALTFSNALVEISSSMALILWLVQGYVTKTWIPKNVPKDMLFYLLAFTAWSVLSIVWSEYPEKSVRGALKILQQVFIFLTVLGTFRREKDVDRFERFVLLFFAVIIFDCFYQYHFGKDLFRQWPGDPSAAGFRVTGPFGTYGKLGAHLTLVLPFIFFVGLYFRNHLKSWNLWYVASLQTFMGGLVLFLTRSRGAILALVLGTFITLIFRKKFIVAAFLSASLGLSYLVLPHNMIVHLDREGKEQSVTERFYLWDRALHVISAKPLLGTGINTYAAAHQQYDKTQNWRVRGYYAHNGYLQTAAETGIPSLILFVLFLFSYFFHSFRELLILRKTKTNPHQYLARLGLLTGILNFLIFAFVDTLLHNPQPAITFWYLLGLQLAYRNIRLVQDQELAC